MLVYCQKYPCLTRTTILLCTNGTFACSLQVQQTQLRDVRDLPDSIKVDGHTFSMLQIQCSPLDGPRLQMDLHSSQGEALVALIATCWDS